jgi:hypothetical protein
MRRLAARLSLFAFVSSTASAVALAQVDDFEFDVDLELALAVDVSRSMDMEEQRVQREGYVAAFRHPDVIDAIRTGPLGRIAVTYFEWAGPGDRRTVVPWTLIETAADGDGFATLLEQTVVTRASGTSISGAMLYAAGLFGQTYSGWRQTLDISGDGPNNSGRPVAPTRDWLLERGITINGLPIMLNRVFGYGPYGIAELDIYYEDCVIGGPAAFVIPVRTPEEFAEAIRRKLVLEIAGVAPTVMYAAQTVSEPRVDCLIGEKSRRGMFNWELPEQPTPGRR